MIDAAFEKLLELQEHTPEAEKRREAQEHAAEQSKRVRQESKAAAMDLMSSDGWAWFENACELLAQEKERKVLNLQVIEDPRTEDRLRGVAYAYRRLPRLVAETANQAIEE